MAKEIKPKFTKKLLLNFNKYGFSELQCYSFSVLCGFLVDLECFHRVIVPPFTLSYIELGLPAVILDPKYWCGLWLVPLTSRTLVWRSYYHGNELSNVIDYIVPYPGQT